MKTEKQVNPKKAIYLTRKQKISIMLKNRSREIAEQLAVKFPFENTNSYEDCYEAFYNLLTLFINQHENFKMSIIWIGIYSITCINNSCTLEIEYYKECGVIVFYFKDYYIPESLELIRFNYAEYKQAIAFISEINNVLTNELLDYQDILSALQVKQTNPKIFEIAVSSIKVVCTGNNDALWVYPFFSEIDAYILVSPDGKDIFIIEMLLSNSCDKISELIKLCKIPVPFVSEDRTISCIKLHEITIQELRQIFKYTDFDEREVEFWMD